MNEAGKDIEKIVLQYADGSTKEITKGFIADVCDNEATKSSTITFEMVGISGRDLACVVESVLQLGIKMGMFSDEPNEE